MIFLLNKCKNPSICSFVQFEISNNLFTNTLTNKLNYNKIGIEVQIKLVWKYGNSNSKLFLQLLFER